MDEEDVRERERDSGGGDERGITAGMIVNVIGVRERDIDSSE